MIGALAAQQLPESGQGVEVMMKVFTQSCDSSVFGQSLRGGGKSGRHRRMLAWNQTSPVCSHPQAPLNVRDTSQHISHMHGFHYIAPLTLPSLA